MADHIFLTDSKPKLEDAKNPRSTAVGASAPIRTDSFVKKAQRLGIPVLPAEEARAKYVPLFQFERRRPIPPGVEQINEDMFALKHNKFIVLNGAAVDSWRHGVAVTKVSHAENILLTAL